ncbi:MAG: multidrug transporter AcrB [Ponticaulis sp.]|nr:multidrug transporter AcrB [Ponticaulis sp.]
MNFDRLGLPELAVKRPLLIAVFNLLIVIASVAALFGVEVRELPDVDRPIVSVTASLPGGAPETMDADVTSVLEGAVATVSGVKEINASSEENNSRIRIEFNTGVNLDAAASDVREAVNRVQRRLPDRVENVFVTKADDDARPIIQLAVESSIFAEDELTRIIKTDISPEIQAIDGVATLQEFGTRERQMRVVIDPQRLNRFGLTISDIAAALRQAPFDVPVGSFRSDAQELIVRAQATASTPELIREVIISGDVTIGDVGDVVLGPADANNLLRLNGAPVIGLGVVRQAQSNTIQISDAVNQKVEQLNQRLQGVTIRITSDDAIFIKKSVREVLITLLITVSIVIATIWIFLGSWKATLVPSVAIPVALIGTIAGIWMMGFSINLLTLLALVLATGLIVDDAIVVLENIQRQQYHGAGRRAAAAVGTHQVFFAVIATTAVLVAVFVPISFLPSTVGRLFREFGFVLAFAVIISSFVALTLSPAIASKLNLAENMDKKTFITRFGNVLKDGYGRVLKLCLRFPLTTFFVSLLIAGSAYFALQNIDSELVPNEDRSKFEVMASGPDGVGLYFMERQADELEAVLQPYLDSGEIVSLFTTVGRWDPNRVGITAELAPWEERERSQDDIVNEVRRPLGQIPGVRASAFGRGSLSFGGRGREGLQVALTGPDYETIYQATRKLADAVETQSQILTNAEISYQPTQPQLSINVDRRRAADLNVPLDQVSLTLRAMVGGENVIDLNVQDQVIPIMLEAEPRAIETPTDLSNLFVRSSAGALVPLSSLTTLVEEGVAAELERVEQRRAIDVQMDIIGDVSIADAIVEINRIADETLPEGIGLILRGEAATLGESNRDLMLTYGFALVIVFLVLVAQFESLTSPLVILVSVPFALAAAVLSIYFSGGSLNIYSQIGLILLIGLMSKNGVLLVEFANQLRKEGKSIHEAVFDAATIRARPIVMTVISTAIGALPLILSTGAGAEARNAIGWVIFGGLGLSSIFTLFLTPCIYLGLARIGSSRGSNTEAELAAELDDFEQSQSRPAGPAE